MLFGRRRIFLTSGSKLLCASVNSVMAQTHLRSQLQRYNIPNVLKTGTVFGRGGYSKVMEMKLPDGTAAAGKKIYNDSASSESRVKIEEECLR